MIADDRRVLRDAELVGLLADEPELLAIVDAYAATQQGHRSHRRPSTRVARLGLLAAVIAAIAVPAAAFADQIGQLLGISNSGTALPSTAFPARQVSALERVGFPTGQVRVLAERSGISFYAARSDRGDYCFAVGFSPTRMPRIDALNCTGDRAGSFPSSSDPIADFSRLNAAGNTTYVTTLAGFATDGVATIAIEGAEGIPIYSAPVADNVYAATDLPQMPATSIVALDRGGKVLFLKSFQTPPVPQPATP